VQWKLIRRGWFFGDDHFKQELLEQMGEGFGRRHGGEERQEAAEARAEALVAEELEKVGWKAGELEQRRKGDAGKVRTARQLRRETTMTLDWIAQRLRMGSASTVAQCLRSRKR